MMISKSRRLFFILVFAIIPGLALSAIDPDACTRCGAGIRVSPASIDFGTQKLGTQSASKLIGVSNIGVLPAKINKIASTNTAFTQTNNCPKSLARNQSCTVVVTFSPTKAKTYSGKIKVVTNQGTAVALLSGVGVAE